MHQHLSKSVWLVTMPIIAVAIAACGGGGGSSAIVPPPTPTPTGVTCQVKLAHGFGLARTGISEDFRHAVVPRPVGPGPAVRVCPRPRPGYMECMAWLRTDARSIRPDLPGGYGPSDLQAAYGLTIDSAANGGGQIIAVVDAYDDPHAVQDLGVYRSTFGLSACTTANGCFLKVNENGKASPLPGTDPTGGWEAEESLDLDMASAICPNCAIELIEASQSVSTDFYTAEDTAASKCGATEISNSWGGSEYSQETTDDSHFTHPGIMITVSAGDNGYGVSFPASSAHVTSVGGTSLRHIGSTWSQSAWSGTGSGCSFYIAQPAWQTALGSAYTSVCAKRIDNDVSAVADPSTGVALYDSFGGSPGVSCSSWCVAGGTSASSPLVDAVYALAGNGATSNYSQDPYIDPSALTDVTTGNNGSCGGTFLCNAETGYDGPTGLGTPIGTGAF